MRRMLLATAVAGVALVLAGCGDDGGASSAARRDPADVFKAASTKSAAEKSAKFSMSMKVQGAEDSTTMTADGAVEFGTQRMRMAMDVGNLMPGGGTIEIVGAGTVIYMKMPPGSVPMPTPWLKLDLNVISKQQGIDFGALQSFAGGNDPTAAMQFLRGASDDVKEVGTEDVRGTETTKYTATVDLRKAVAAAPQAARSSMEAAIKQLGSSTMPVTAWIDDDGLLRRMAMVIKTPATPAGGAGTMDMTMEFFDYGADVDVEVPPADQVTDFVELMGQLGGGNK